MVKSKGIHRRMLERNSMGPDKHTKDNQSEGRGPIWAEGKEQFMNCGLIPTLRCAKKRND